MRKMKMFPKKRHLMTIFIVFALLFALWHFFLRGRMEGFDGPIAANPAFATDLANPKNPIVVIPEAQMPAKAVSDPVSVPVPAAATTSATTPCNYTDLKLCQDDKSCTWSNDKCSVTPGSTSVAAGQDNAAPATPTTTTPVPSMDSLAAMVKGITGK